MGLYSVLPDEYLIIGNLFIYQNELIMLSDVNAHGEILSFKFILKDGKPYPWHTLTLTVSAKNKIKILNKNIKDFDILNHFDFIPDESSISGNKVKMKIN